jgi:serine/threonine-protein kinase
VVLLYLILKPHRVHEATPPVVTQQETTLEPKGRKSQKQLVNNSPPLESFLKFQIRPWARVYIDDEYWETTPTHRLLVVEPGRHKLTLINDSLPVHDELVEVQAGETLSVEVDLMANLSWLAISVQPWGELYIDGVHITNTPIAEPIPIRPGRHRLLITHPSLLSYETTIEVEPGDTISKLVVLRANR